MLRGANYGKRTQKSIGLDTVNGERRTEINKRSAIGIGVSQKEKSCSLCQRYAKYAYYPEGILIYIGITTIAPGNIVDGYVTTVI